MIHRVRPQPPDDPFKRGKAEKPEGHDDKRKVEKTRETEPDERKRRKFRKHLEQTEKKEKAPESKRPSPYESEFYEHEPKEKVSEKLEKRKEGREFKKSQKLEEDLEVPEGKKQHPMESKETKTTEHLAPHPEDRIEQKKFEKKAAHPPPKEEVSEKSKKEKEIPSIPTAPEVPLAIMQRASEITQDLSIYLNPEISPIFEQMIGRILVMTTKEGIMKTEITLNNPELENSVFYGSTITLEKYSTAPDSFNIHLTGNPQAVTIFNGNIDMLTESFRRGNFNFRVGRIEAAYETDRPLFRRKREVGGEEMGEGPPQR